MSNDEGMMNDKGSNDEKLFWQKLLFLGSVIRA